MTRRYYSPEVEAMIANDLEQRHLAAEYEDQARMIDAFPVASVIVARRRRLNNTGLFLILCAALWALVFLLR